MINFSGLSFILFFFFGTLPSLLNDRDIRGFQLVLLLFICMRYDTQVYRALSLG